MNIQETKRKRRKNVEESGGLHPKRSRVFAERLFDEDGGCPPLVDDVMGDIQIPPDKRFMMLAQDQDLIMRSLSALGVLASLPENQSQKVEDWLTTLAIELAQIDGSFDPMKLLILTSGLRRGKQRALAGADPFSSEKAPASDQQLAHAGEALIGGFILVALADGGLDEAETTAFLHGLVTLKDPLLCRMRDAAGDPRPILERLLGSPDKVHACLRAAAQVFERDPGGSSARREFMSVLKSIADADGVVHKKEQLVLDVIMTPRKRCCDRLRAQF